jgi:hypothetical protein
VRTKRSAIALAFGDLIGVLMIATPSLRKTLSKSRVNLLSRSRMRKRTGVVLSAKSQVSWRACWVTQAPSGLRVQPTQVDAPTAKLDEEERVQPLQADRFNGQEVDGKHALCLRAEKLAPRKAAALARWAETSLAQQVSNGTGRDGEAQTAKFAGDPLVAPARILTR